MCPGPFSVRKDVSYQDDKIDQVSIVHNVAPSIVPISFHAHLHLLEFGLVAPSSAVSAYPVMPAAINVEALARNVLGLVWRGSLQ
jgi:hypothetical protein